MPLTIKLAGNGKLKANPPLSSTAIAFNCDYQTVNSLAQLPFWGSFHPRTGFEGIIRNYNDFENFCASVNLNPATTTILSGIGEVDFNNHFVILLVSYGGILVSSFQDDGSGVLKANIPSRIRTMCVTSTPTSGYTGLGCPSYYRTYKMCKNGWNTLKTQVTSPTSTTIKTYPVY